MNLGGRAKVRNLDDKNGYWMFSSSLKKNVMHFVFSQIIEKYQFVTCSFPSKYEIDMDYQKVVHFYFIFQYEEKIKSICCELHSKILNVADSTKKEAFCI